MSKNKQAKRMGRPPKPEGPAIVVPVRLPPPIAEAVDIWAETAGLNRSEAMRQLIEAGLKRPPKLKARGS
jgi:hypothetical protein